MTPLFFVGGAFFAVAVRAFVNFDRWRYRRQAGDLPWNWRALVGPGAYYAWLRGSEDERG